MNCHDAQAVLHGYLDGELDPSVSLNYEQHVGACPACGKALAEQQALQAEMKADSLYFKTPAILRDRLRASLRQQYGTRPVRFAWRWLAAAACLAVCAGLGFLLARFTITPSAHERLTQEVAQCIQELLDPLGVGVVAEAQHFCMMMRGVEKQHSGTVTSAMLGAFRERKETRDEFLSLIRGR